MTHEGQGPRPDETATPLTPPTSTRWSEEPVEDVPDLAPPFVARRADPGAGGQAGGLREETAEAATAPAPGGTEAASADEPAPFPFETELDEDAPGTPVPADDDDFPFDQFDIEGDDDAGVAADETADEEPEPWGELPPEPAPWAETVAESVDDAPTAGSAAGTEPGLDEREPALGPAGSAGEQMASLLERLARTIRADGEAGVRREIDSEDRLTSLIAGLLAGHLSARS